MKTKGRKKKIKIGINGFGRIGRAIYRINHFYHHFDVPVINDINPDIKNLAYLLQYDSTYGRFPDKVETKGASLIVKSKPSKVFRESHILDVPWSKYGVDVVIDASGIKENLKAMLGTRTNIKHFIVTNAPSPELTTVIFGVNEDEFDPHDSPVISASICDTIALAPIIKLITKTHRIESGYLITLHPWLSYQNLLDGRSVSWSVPGDTFSHYALGRAATQNIIPKSTSAVLAADFVFPGLSKKLHSFSYRVPTQIVTSASLVLLLNKKIKQHELVDRFVAYEKRQKYKVIRNSDEPLTSLDYRRDDHSAVIDHRWTKVLGDRHLKLVYWYDNEWGYASRVMDLICKIAECQ